MALGDAVAMEHEAGLCPSLSRFESSRAAITAPLRRSTVQLTLIREVFELFDTDGEQQLDEEELASAIFAMGFCQHGHAEVLCALFLSLIPPRKQECKAHLPLFYPYPMGLIAQAQVCQVLFQSLPRYPQVTLLLWVNSISVSVQ